MNTVPGYEQLQDVLQSAMDQASMGKGAERHANDLPFHEQPMQSVSDMLDSDAGLAFQAIKKIREGRCLPHDARERELLGAINYIAGMVIFHRRRLTEAEQGPIIGFDLAKGEDYGATVTGNTEGGRLVIDEVKFDEKRADIIGQNGNDGEHYDAIEKEESRQFRQMADRLTVPASEPRRSPEPKPRPAPIELPDTDKMVDATGRPKWKDVPSWVQWLGQDRKGVWTGFAAKPEPRAGRWFSTKRYIELNSGEPLIGENWTHMLEQRP